MRDMFTSQQLLHILSVAWVPWPARSRGAFLCPTCVALRVQALHRDNMPNTSDPTALERKYWKNVSGGADAKGYGRLHGSANEVTTAMMFAPQPCIRVVCITTQNESPYSHVPFGTVLAHLPYCRTGDAAAPAVRRGRTWVPVRPRLHGERLTCTVGDTVGHTVLVLVLCADRTVHRGFTACCVPCTWLTWAPGDRPARYRNTLHMHEDVGRHYRAYEVHLHDEHALEPWISAGAWKPTSPRSFDPL